MKPQINNVSKKCSSLRSFFSGTRARNRRCVRKDDGTTAGDDACSKPIPAVCEPMWVCIETRNLSDPLAHFSLHSACCTEKQPSCPHIHLSIDIIKQFICFYFPVFFISFRWTVLELEKCSKSCGAGTRSRIVKCLEKVGEDNFRETNSCTAVKPTIITEPCNEFPCPAQWKIGEWSEVSSQ